jgi:hypothetical protein
MRDKKLQQYIESIDHSVKEICDMFSDFSDGPRFLMLMQRAKDGGHNKEEKRVFKTEITFSSKEFEGAVRGLLFTALRYNVPLRLYASVNSRDTNKVIHYIEQQLLEVHYSDEVKRENTYQKLLAKPRHFFMQKSNRASNYFILDIDEGEDDINVILREIAENDITEVLRYKTPNGWHIVTEPFKPSLVSCDVKKDGMLLLKAM